ncbi:DKNYY domain-containing protein [Hymenobacter sp. BRD67]|uniref:DKNYY domain-containing protein n=1 Tax=Hymenobacter sp. BRD67 TaxID=2675877 RepID=UPI0015659435|nr:DKNYY domain-containing protein [Hymenobacter sp. BRD67]QKG51858.1 DKNYY domain-containing protein [Hymenobacter sp. BRD67]
MNKIASLILTLAVCFFLCSCKHYEVKDNRVYYDSWNEGSGNNSRLIESAQASSFIELKYSAYGKDDRHVYYEGKIISKADPKSFEAIGEFFGKDKKSGFYGDKRVGTSRGKSFKVLKGNYSVDNHDVFYMDEPLNVCSVSSFKIREENNGWWSQDDCNYFFEEKKLPATDPKTFQILGDTPFAKDSHHVFFQSRRLDYDLNGRKYVDTIDAASFKVVNYFVGHDKFGCIDSHEGRISCLD